MIRLSVVIITYNEEKNIGRCIDSVKIVADEVLVLDSFSTDRTEEICRSRGARFFQHRFDGHIEQKNRALDLASGPYVLSLDADEELDEILQHSVLQAKQNWKADGYTMNRLSNYCGKWIRHSHWYPDKKLRLFDRRKGHWTGVNPHDKYELTAKESPALHLNGNILHYSYSNLEQHRSKTKVYADIAARALAEREKRIPSYKLIVNPAVKFISHYLLHLGFLDGRAGFRIARLAAFGTFLKYSKARALCKRHAGL